MSTFFNNKLLSSNEVLESAMISGNEEGKSVISVSSSEIPLVQYESNHKTFKEGMTMFQYYGIIKDVKGDGSRGNHALVLLLQRMDLVNKDISVSRFQKNIFSHIHKHMRKFTGANGGNYVFEYIWGESSQA